MYYENLLPMIIGLNSNKLKKSKLVFENFKRKALLGYFSYGARQNWTFTFYVIYIY